MKKLSLYQYCKKNNGIDVCNYNNGIIDAVDQQLGFLNCWYPNKHKELKEEFSKIYDQFQIDWIIPEDLYSMIEEIENILYSVKIKGYYLVTNNGYMFFVDSQTYKKEFKED